uniref:Plexin B2 n=1 Tax=Gorilla gorilla gorilla TaxID=9595 RepID=A0A2I2YYL0_GORGO
MRTLFLELLEQYVVAKNPKLMLRRSETVVERMLSNWMSICLYQYLKDSAGEPLYKLFKAIKHQVEKGPVDAVQKKAKYTLNDTGLLGDDVEYAPLTVSVIVQDEGVDAIPVKVLNCDTISQVKEKIIDQVYRGQPCQTAWSWVSADPVRPGPDVTAGGPVEARQHPYALQCPGWSHPHPVQGGGLPAARGQPAGPAWGAPCPPGGGEPGVAPGAADRRGGRGQVQERQREREGADEGHHRDLPDAAALSQGHTAAVCGQLLPERAVKYFFDFLDEQAEKHNIQDEDTIHIWKTNSLPLRFWVNILKNPHFIFDVWWTPRCQSLRR